MASQELDTAAQIATIWSAVYPLVIGGGAGIVTSFGYLKFFRKKEARLIKNWKRPIGVIPSQEYGMDNEVLLLKKSSLFDNVTKFAPEARSIDNITDKYRLVIVRFEPDSEMFWEIYESLKIKQVPTIIYAEQGKIKPADFLRIQSYTFHTICNTPVRLIGDVSSIMGAYPSAKEFK